MHKKIYGHISHSVITVSDTQVHSDKIKAYGNGTEPKM